MKDFYIKYKRGYINGETTKNYSYYKFDKDGRILAISMSKRTLSSPESVTIPAGYEVITQLEFENVKSELGF